MVHWRLSYRSPSSARGAGQAFGGRVGQELGAPAFTHCRDIFFRQGTYNPGSGIGRKLLAHELTHVAQQGAGGQV